METRNNKRFDGGAVAACMGMVLFLSTGPIFIKFLAGHIDSWTQNMLRYIVAGLFWLPVLLISIRTKKLDKSVWRRALFPAAANIAMQSFWARAFYYSGPAFLNLLSKSSVLWIAGFSLIFFADERGLVRSKRFWTGAVLSLTGITGVLLSKEDFTAAATMTGIVLILAASFMWAVYIIGVKIFLNDIDSRISFCVTSLYTIAGLCVLGAVFGRPGECFEMAVWPWACVIISGITSIGLAHVLYYSAMKRIGATIPMIVLLSTPFTILAISSVVFGESLNAWQWFFGLILIAGSGLSIWAKDHLTR